MPGIIHVEKSLFARRFLAIEIPTTAPISREVFVEKAAPTMRIVGREEIKTVLAVEAT